MRTVPALVAAALVSLSPAAAAQERSASYASHILLPAEPADAAIAAFASQAGETLRRYASTLRGGREAASPAGDLFTETVTVFVGGTELTPRDDFELLGRFAREELLALLAGFVESEPARSAIAQARGAELVGALMSDGMFGRNAAFGGATCSGSFEKLPHADMQALLETTGTKIDDWGVARVPGAQAGFLRGTTIAGWPVGQLLHVDPDAPPIRSCCWDYVVLPDGFGVYVQMFYGGSPFVAYLSGHVCFTLTPEGWRISAVALRR